MRNRIVVAAMVLLGALAACMKPAVRGANPTPVRIGALPTMFPGGKVELGPIIKVPVESAITSHTGLDSDVELVLSLNAMRRKLSDGRLQFGLCHGYELAWMQKDEPLLQPLMLVVPDHLPLKAYLVVTSSHPARELCDLAGATLALPQGVNAIVQPFADHDCRCHGKSVDEIFAKTTRPVNAETALHDLFDDRAQAALVDGKALRCFEERYPARAKLVRVLIESNPFPLSAIVYHAGMMDPAVLRRFQNGMTGAHRSLAVKKLMALMHAVGFEPAPLDYDEQLAACAREYPKPGLLKKVGLVK